MCLVCLICCPTGSFCLYLFCLCVFLIVCICCSLFLGPKCLLSVNSQIFSVVVRFGCRLNFFFIGSGYLLSFTSSVFLFIQGCFACYFFTPAWFYCKNSGSECFPLTLGVFSLLALGCVCPRHVVSP